MKDKLVKDIENITSILGTLPTNNKKNKEKYKSYLKEQIDLHIEKRDKVKKEILSRYNKIIFENNKDADIPNISELDINFIRCSSSYYDSLEKMNLNYLLYELSHFYKNNLEKINEVIIQIIKEFEKTGIKLTAKDFIYSNDVRLYINALLSKDVNIKTMFEEIFWRNPNFIHQIEINFRYLYYKNEKAITKFFTDKYNTSKMFDYLSEYKKAYDNQNYSKHNSVKYIFNKFFSGKMLTAWVNDKHVDDFNKKYILGEKTPEVYFNLIKLKDSLEEYKTLQYFSFIIDDLINLFAKKEEYKDVYNSKLKEINKKEGELFKINKKLNKKGFFGLKENKLNELILLRNNIINELKNFYEELKELKIKNIIYNKVSDDTSYLDLLKLSLTDFNYFVKLLKENNENLDIKYIDSQMKKLYNFIYTSDINIISNVAISENKNIPQIIYDRYRLVNLEIDEASLEGDSIKNIIHDLENMILNQDIKRLKMNLNDIDFVLDVREVLGLNNDDKEVA
ncbi:MAG: hypothetical protein GX951_05630 [Mollicutes bacterium]|nr:hypothetical protein [Mollicutes bacterium]